jgi:hypothetical protein
MIGADASQTPTTFTPLPRAPSAYSPETGSFTGCPPGRAILYAVVDPRVRH